jgi:hypothetical protein
MEDSLKVWKYAILGAGAQIFSFADIDVMYLVPSMHLLSVIAYASAIFLTIQKILSKNENP